MKRLALLLLVAASAASLGCQCGRFGHRLNAWAAPSCNTCSSCSTDGFVDGAIGPEYVDPSGTVVPGPIVTQ